jgi:hypothetical protein
MCREWFQIARHPIDKASHHPLADPLEGEEWRGLGWAVPLLAWWAEGRRPVSRHTRDSQVSTRHPANA